MRLHFPISDARAVRRVLAGHPEEFETLVFRYQRKAFAVAQAMGVPRSGLDDVVQEAFLQSFRDLGGLLRPSRFGPWFLQIVRHAACRSLRRTDGASIHSLPEPAAPATDACEAEDFGDYLRAKVQALPDGIREAVFIYYYESGSVAEVARALSISRAAAKKRLQRGRDALRSALWRELEESLRDMVPSAREWTARGRGLALAVLAAVPFSLRARAASVLLPPRVGLTASSTSAASSSVLVAALKGKVLLLLIAGLVTAGVGERLAGLSAITGYARRERPFLGLTSAPSRGAQSGAPAGRRVAGHAPGTPGAAGATPLLTIRVEDSEGRAVADSRVAVTWKEERSVGGPPILRNRGFLVPSSPGEFLLRERRGDAVVLTVDARGFAPRAEERAVPPESVSEPVVIVLERGQELRGRLVDLSRGGAPVARATVGLVGPDIASLVLGPQRWISPMPRDLGATAPFEVLAALESDDAGRFSIAGLPGTLWVTGDGLGPTAVYVGSGSTPESDRAVAIPMYPPTTFKITALCEDGEPVERFTYAFAETLDDLPESPFANAIEGSRTVHAICHACRLRSGGVEAAKEIAVGVESDGCTVTRTVEVEYGRANDILISLRSSGASIIGRVTGPAGEAIAGARVTLAGASSRASLGDVSSGRRTSTAATDANGDYEVQVAGRSPPYFLAVEHPAFATFLGGPFRELAGRRTRHDVQLGPGSTVRVHVAGSGRGSTPAEGSRMVRLETPPSFGLRAAFEYRREVEIDATGVAELDKVPPGAWLLTWLEPRMRTVKRSRVSVSPGRIYEISLGSTDDAGAHVPGFVHDRGAPVAGAELWLTSQDSLAARAVSDASGRFVLTGVQPGTYDLVVRPVAAPRGPGVRRLKWRVGEGPQPMEIDLSTTALSGRVAGSGGEPLDLVEVEAFEPSFVDGESRWTLSHAVETDPEGEFKLSRLYVTPHVLVFRKAGYLSQVMEWEPCRDAKASLAAIRLDPAHGNPRLRFHVTDAETGGEVAPVSIELYSIRRQEPLSFATLSRSGDGEPLEAVGPPSGHFRAIVSAEPRSARELASEVVDFDHDGASDAEVAIQMRPGTAADLRIATEDGLLPSDTTVQILDPSGTPLVFPGHLSRLPFSGRGVLHGLPSGDLRARMEAPGMDAIEALFRAEPDAIANVVFAGNTSN